MLPESTISAKSVELIAVGAMYQSPMKMAVPEPDVLMLETTHGIVEINLIPLPAHQDGPVMKLQENALWPSQVTDSVQELPVKLTATQ